LWQFTSSRPRFVIPFRSETARRGRKLLLVETSSQEMYGGTIQFYEKTGYQLVGKIKEYYKPGDDKLIFAKKLQAPVAIAASDVERPPAVVRHPTRC